MRNGCARKMITNKCEKGHETFCKHYNCIRCCLCADCTKEHRLKAEKYMLELEKNLNEKGKDLKGFYYVEDYEEICRNCIETLETHNERKIKYCPSCFCFINLNK